LGEYPPDSGWNALPNMRIVTSIFGQDQTRDLKSIDYVVKASVTKVGHVHGRLEFVLAST